MTILPNAEKQGELVQLGGWQKEMARRRYQKGNLRKRSKRNPVWELQWWTDCIKSGRNARTKAGIDDSQLCVRPHSAASAQACRGTSSSLEFGQGHAAFEFTVAGIRGAALRPQCLPHPKTFHPGALSPCQARFQSPTTLWFSCFSVFRNAKNSLITAYFC